MSRVGRPAMGQIQPFPFVYMLSVAAVTLQQRSERDRDGAWPAKLKIFAIWAFLENVC